jgi:hypothetical protein
MSKKLTLMSFGIIVVGALILSGCSNTDNQQSLKDDESISPPPSSSPVPDPVDSNEEEVGYEIVNKTIKGTVLRLEIYIAEKDDDKLIQLTDKLIEENGDMTHITAFYFDDKQVAKDYFSKFDERSEAEEEQMFAHFIAKLTYNTTNNYKVLSKLQDGEEVGLKTY